MLASNLLAHRGFWTHKQEQNTLYSLKTALDYGFGIETDFRDFNGRVYVSHDCPLAEEAPNLVSLESFLELVSAYDSPKIACNVKADGLIDAMHADFAKFNLDLKNFKFFDMSIPQHYLYSKSSFDTWTRLSEFEPISINYFNSSGYWLDGFHSDDVIIKNVKIITDDNVEFALVSSELHGRDPSVLWRFIRDNNIHNQDGFYLCTDLPIAAMEFFGESK